MSTTELGKRVARECKDAFAFLLKAQRQLNGLCRTIDHVEDNSEAWERSLVEPIEQ